MTIDDEREYFEEHVGWTADILAKVERSIPLDVRNGFYGEVLALANRAFAEMELEACDVLLTIIAAHGHDQMDALSHVAGWFTEWGMLARRVGSDGIPALPDLSRFRSLIE